VGEAAALLRRKARGVIVDHRALRRR